MGRLMPLTPLLISAALTAAVGLYAWTLRERVTAARAFAGVQLLASTWTVLCVAELLAPTLRQKLLFERLQDAPMVLAGVATLAFALRYVGRTPRWSPVLWVVLAAIPTSLVLENVAGAVQGPLDPSVRLEPIPPFGSLVYDLSRVDVAIVAAAATYALVALAFLLAAASRQHRVHRRQTLLLALGFALPTIGGVVALAFDVRYAGQRDVTPALFGIAAAATAWALFSHRVLDLVPVARHLIVERLPDAVIVIDRRERVADANLAAARFLVVAPDEAIGQPAADVVAEWSKLSAALAGSIGPEGARISSGGSVFDVRASLVGPRQHPAGHAIVLRDITAVDRANVELREAREDLERRVAERTRELFETNEWLQREVSERAAVIADLERAERERSALEERLERNQRIDAMGRFAAGIGHDFNNLLTTILANAQLARSEVEGRRDLAEMLDDLVQAAEEAGRLTNQLLACRGHQSVSPEPVALEPAIEALRPRLASLLGDRISFRADVGAASKAWVDPQLLEQIVVGLAARATDALRNGGTLSIDARDATLRLDEARARGVEPGRWVVLTVRDDGEPLDEDALHELLDPFHVRAAGAHRGLGLVTVHGAVGRSGGFVEALAGPGRGTAFEVWLPSAEGRTVPAPPGAEALAGAGERLMLVEDQEPVRLATTRVLQRLGYRVRAFASGSEALAALTDGEPVDLLVTDVQMPDLSGPALVETARRRRPGLPVLYVSGLVEDGDADIRRAREDASWLSKPFTPEALADAVQRALRGGRESDRAREEPRTRAR